MTEQEAYDRASKALAALTRERDEKRYTARAAVIAEYQERCEVLAAAVQATRQTLDAARIAQATTALETLPKGVLVEWGHPKFYRSWERGPLKPLRRAVLEVCTPTTKLPMNQTWNRPKLGDVFLRILKKDGTPGLAVERYDPGRRNWIPEGEQPAVKPKEG